ncbi:MAG TPA: hypothetical protein VHZ30_03150, partial [Verrucomicrobiae bacterium]|nr:hypothetical protein [Verrucomicrobiae bacterium]
RASSIQVVGGASVNYNKQNLTSYNTSVDPGVIPVSTAELSQPTTLSGYCDATGDITISANVTLSNPIVYLPGNLTIAPGATVSGTGTIVVLGNLTIQSGAVLNLQSSTALALGVGGKLIIEK